MSLNTRPSFGSLIQHKHSHEGMDLAKIRIKKMVYYLNGNILCALFCGILIFPQCFFLNLSSPGLFGSSQHGGGGGQSAPHHNFFVIWRIMIKLSKLVKC